MSEPSPVLGLSPIRRAAFRGAVFALVCLVAFAVVLNTAMARREGAQFLLWATFIGLIAAPLSLVETFATRRAQSLLVQGMAGLLCLAIAVGGIAAAFAQAGFSASLLMTGSVDAAAAGLPQHFKTLTNQRFVAFALGVGAAFGLVTLSRLRQHPVLLQTVLTALVAVVVGGLLGDGSSKFDRLLVLVGVMAAFLPSTCWGMDALERRLWPAEPE